MNAPANELEQRRWNDEHWAAVWPRREQLTSAVTDLLLTHLAPVEGQRVLDVGSGGGTTAFAVAARVGGDSGSRPGGGGSGSGPGEPGSSSEPGGSGSGAAGSKPGGWVLGADISAPLVRFAGERARDLGWSNVSFTVADVQQDTIDGGPFDAVLSQFGVMFFDEPPIAFANIRAHTVPGGRLAFACWQPADRNPWWAGWAVAEFAPPPQPPPPGKVLGGPFALGDVDYTTAILAGAGWTNAEHTPYKIAVAVEREAITLDEHQMRFMGITDLDGARAALDTHLDGLRRDDGRYDAELAFQIFTATA